MSRSTRRSFGWTFAALLTIGGVGAFAVGGCGSSGGKKSDSSAKAVSSITNTRNELVKAKTEVTQANASLDKLQAGGDVQKSFSQFSKEAGDVKAAGERARARAKDMQDRGRAYIAAWEQEMAQVSSPELRASAEARRANVRESFGGISKAAHSTREAYEPYMKGLTELQTALAADLTPAGVTAAAPAMQKTKADGEVLNQRLDALIAELDKVGAGMGATPPKK
jgi:predicted  nucleic acid-binding Zn-ribbon protein